MKRLMTLCIVLVGFALIASPALAEVQNVKVSGDVNAAGVYRTNYDLQSANQTSPGALEDNNSILTQARVAIDADLTDNVSVAVRFLSEYDWNTEDNTSSTGDTVALDVASVTLEEVFFAPLSVTVGRQELVFGNAFVLGDPDTNGTSQATNLTALDLSLRKSFDAVSAVLDYDPLVVDLIYAKIDETATTLVGTPSTTTADDEDLYGINVAYDIGGQMESEIEGFWLFKRDNSQVTPGISTVKDTYQSGHEIHTYGVRGSLVPIEDLNILAEVAIQTGDYDKTAAVQRDQDASAYQVAADYTFPDIEVPWVDIVIGVPAIKVGYTHYSGEEVLNSGDHGAWIPLYEDQTHGLIANYVLSGVNGGQNSNADILNVGASIEPLEDLTVSLDFYQFWFDEKIVAVNNQAVTDNLNQPTGWTNLDETDYFMNADDDIGFELDLALNYDYSEDVDMGLSAGWFKPGDAFQGASGTNENGETAIQLLATLDVAF